MSKRSILVQETIYCGINVTAKSLTLAIQRVHQPVEQRSFSNASVGHKALIVWLRKAKSPVRVYWKQREFTLSISRLHLMQRKGSRSQS
jgi:hypothetical protein